MNTIILIIWNFICALGKYKFFFIYVLKGKMVVTDTKIIRATTVVARYCN
jgi:hypothetical protein